MEKKRLLTVRMSEEEYAEIVEKARLAGRTLSVLVRESLGRVKTWTAKDQTAFKERTLVLARIGSALGKLSRLVRQNPSIAPRIMPELQRIYDVFYRETHP